MVWTEHHRHIYITYTFVTFTQCAPTCWLRGRAILFFISLWSIATPLAIRNWWPAQVSYQQIICVNMSSMTDSYLCCYRCDLYGYSHSCDRGNGLTNSQPSKPKIDPKDQIGGQFKAFTFTMPNCDRPLLILVLTITGSCCPWTMKPLWI